MSSIGADIPQESASEADDSQAVSAYLSAGFSKEQASAIKRAKQDFFLTPQYI